jgi:hypothetical protein
VAKISRERFLRCGESLRKVLSVQMIMTYEADTEVISSVDVQGFKGVWHDSFH